MDDERNWLFRQYKALITALRPDGFIFENVGGLLTMEGGSVFRMIQEELAAQCSKLTVWKLQAEEYGVPQRRTRIILVGDNTGKIDPQPPTKVTYWGRDRPLFEDKAPAITVGEALRDLPPLTPGEDGAGKDYLHRPNHPYQELMRGMIRPEEYLGSLLTDRSIRNQSILLT